MTNETVNLALTSTNATLHLLIAEDSANDLALLLLELTRAGLRYSHAHVENRIQFEHALAAETFDAVISDYRLPGWNGIDALNAVRVRDSCLPFLLVTGVLGDEAAVDCIKRGANDYILKNHLSRLPRVLQRALAEHALRREHSASQEALHLSELRNRDLVVHSIYGILRANADGAFIDTNPALL